MKKLFLFVLTFVFAVSANAQDPQKTKVDFGIKGGVNVAGIEGDYAREINANYKISLHGGLFSSVQIIEDRIGLQLEALISGKGYKADVQDSILLNSIVHNQFWLDIPFFVQVYTGSGWELHGGVQYSILIAEQYVNFATSRKEKLTVSNNDFGILVGGAYQIDKRNKVGARYIYGLNDIMDFDGKTAHSSLFQIYIGFAFF